MPQVSDLMTKNTISFSPNMLIVDAVQALANAKVVGAPVIDSERKVIGILKESDFIVREINIHLPTFLKLFEQFGLYRKDRALIHKDLDAISLLRVKDIMSYESPVFGLNMSIEEAAKIFVQYRDINSIPVVDSSGRLAGVLSRYDLIKSYAGDVSSLQSKTPRVERYVDTNINAFLKSLRSRFLFVSKRRLRLWVVFSIVCMIAGFFVANVLLLNIEF
jgi:CBS-domain-containing membrane protein